MQGYNVQEADRMSVAIHPSETRPSEVRAHARFRLPVIAGIAGGSAALLVFAVGAFSFFSDLADPRSRPTRIAPVASQWPDLKDGVPALAPATVGSPLESRQASLPTAEPAPPAPPPSAASVQAETPAQFVAPAPVAAQTQGAARDQVAAPLQAAPPPPAPSRASLPIEPAATVPAAARTATALTPAKVTVPLPPSRSETVRAKAEQPAKFVSLPAPKAKPEAVKEAVKSEAKAEARSEPARKAAPAARSRTADAKPTQTATAQATTAHLAQDAADEPELLGVRIPGGRQIREGWDAAVNGLLGGKSGGE